MTPVLLLGTRRSVPAFKETVIRLQLWAVVVGEKPAEKKLAEKYPIRSNLSKRLFRKGFVSKEIIAFERVFDKS